MRFVKCALVAAAVIVGSNGALALAQAPAGGACQLGVAQAPSLRGFRLGMTADQVVALMPTDDLRDRVRLALKEGQAPDRYDLASVDIRSDDVAAFDQYAGVARISVGFYRERVVQVYVEYPMSGPNGAQWRNEAEFIRKVADALRLPGPEAWTPGRHGGRSLNCDGFELNAQIGSPSSLHLIDDSFEADIQGRRQAEEDEKRRAFRP